MNFTDWDFIECLTETGHREWQMRNPADPGQVFYCYAERITRPGKPEHWRRRYGRTSAAPDLPIPDMEELFRALYAARKEKA